MDLIVEVEDTDVGLFGVVLAHRYVPAEELMTARDIVHFLASSSVNHARLCVPIDADIGLMAT